MRFLLYSPDSFGLGHIRRTISISEQLLGDFHGSSALILTGAPRAHYFDYPRQADYVKLPSVSKDGNGRYASRDLDLSFSETCALRSQIIEHAVSFFPPDVLVVDHSPLGLGGEAVSMLRRIRHRSPGTLRVLGLRDLIDEPARVRAAWQKDGVYDAIREYYDIIAIYGQRDIFDPVREYGLPADLECKVRFVGYIHRNGCTGNASDLVARFAPRTGRLVTVTLGGGGDGNLLLRSLLRGYETLGTDPPFEVVAVAGPLMSPKKRVRFAALARPLDGLTLLDRAESLPDLIEASDFVVSMGGYNTVCELACSGARALIVPRTFPRKEQLIRARLLAERGVVDFLDPCDAEPRRLMDEILQGLEKSRPPRGWGLDFSGLRNLSQTLQDATRGPAKRAS